MHPHPNTPGVLARLWYASNSLPRMEGELSCRRAHSHGGPAQPACSDSIITDNTRALFFGTFFCCSPVTKESTEYCLLFPFWSVMHSINVLFRMPYPAITSPPLYKLQNKFKEIALYFFPQKFSFPFSFPIETLCNSITATISGYHILHVTLGERYPIFLRYLTQCPFERWLAHHHHLHGSRIVLYYLYFSQVAMS